MSLKPQDLLVVLKIVALRGDDWAYNRLATALGMSPSEVHAAVKRLLAARLMLLAPDNTVPQPAMQALEEFLLHGLRYAFFPERGALVPGMPTAHAAAPLNEHVLADQEPPPVWPDPQGTVRGYALAPLYPSVPHAARQDALLYELLALADALRDGRARERALAAQLLKQRLHVTERA
jgi:hypothetical protein